MNAHWLASVTVASTLCLASCQTGFIDDGVGLNDDKSDQASQVRVGNFPGPDGPIRAPYLLRGDTAVVGGDILWPASSALSISAAAGPFVRWPGGVIPYENPSNNAAFMEGVNAWNQVSAQTGITLVPRSNQSDYITVIAGQGCYSYMGLKGGAQELSLGNGCYGSAGIHEIGHAIGLMHEHTRADRDSYIRMNWDNIVGGEGGTVAQTNLGITQGATNYSDYDFTSIMHYSNSVSDPAFVKDPSIPLYEIIGSTTTTVNNSALSQSDIAGVASMYQGYGGGTPPSGGQCSIATCAEYSLSEGACTTLSTGSYECHSACLTKVASCSGSQPPPDNGTPPPDNGTPPPPTGNTYSCANGEQIPSNYYCDGVTDCSDSSDENACGSGNGGSGGTTPPPSTDWGGCSVGASGGLCIDTSTTTCFGTLYTGYCPGPNEIRCCI